ncbi:hypothetical protein CMESO_502 (nucleomorph) [Chroomonas mesostigmatica CCMP1168]|uniref:Uncharacterized protein n=1 Tax=Chroomonas mesostigmatica CCMP1168 TaxID=1195612 RepID=J7G6H1_9CRYP|nr:hypothetical protein CMESO_502 [Chroomonas mesostigmatica CCMP1168]|mmetsp:Transcript_66758/g.164518  ORF Transcript_66758/g.164518 Transcript_66758/m.164518 type:complete len:143 (+) Transcript_66758:76-504(+)
MKAYFLKNKNTFKSASEEIEFFKKKKKLTKKKLTFTVFSNIVFDLIFKKTNLNTLCLELEEINDKLQNNRNNKTKKIKFLGNQKFSTFNNPIPFFQKSLILKIYSKSHQKKLFRNDNFLTTNFIRNFFFIFNWLFLKKKKYF